MRRREAEVVCVLPHLSLPSQRGGVERRDASGSENRDRLSVVVYHFKVQILVILPPLDLTARTPLLKNKEGGR